MRKVIFILILLSNLIYANSYNNLLKKDIEGAIKVAKKNISTIEGEDRLMEYANLGHAYILQGKYKLAKASYFASLGIEKNAYISDYKELRKLYPNKNVQLDNGWKIIEELFLKIDKWLKVGCNYSDIQYMRKRGIYNPKEAKLWMDMIISKTKFEALIKMGIKTTAQYKPYSKMPINHIKILKSLKKKPNKLIISMSESGYGFQSAKYFLSTYNFLKNNGCKKIEPTFNNIDEYENEGKCYLFSADMFQRIDRNNGLAINSNWLNEKGSIFYVIFNKSWRDGEHKIGYIKGLGNYKYRTSGGSMKNVAKGKVLKFL